MKFSSAKIVNYMLAKFNSEFIAENKPEDFILKEIRQREGYRYAFQIETRVVASKVVMRIYFNISNRQFMTPYELQNINEEDCISTRAFVSEGTLVLSTISGDGDDDFQQGDGVIDPTQAPFELLLSVCKDEW